MPAKPYGTIVNNARHYKCELVFHKLKREFILRQKHELTLEKRNVRRVEDLVFPQRSAAIIGESSVPKPNHAPKSPNAVRTLFRLTTCSNFWFPDPDTMRSGTPTVDRTGGLTMNQT